YLHGRPERIGAAARDRRSGRISSRSVARVYAGRGLGVFRSLAAALFASAEPLARQRRWIGARTGRFLRNVLRLRARTIAIPRRQRRTRLCARSELQSRPKLVS